MKYSSVDALLDSKNESVKDTVRPNVNVNETAWDNFRFALEYANLNRSARLHSSVVMESFLNDFVENVKARVLKEEGSINNFMMFMAERALEKQTMDAKRRETVKESLKARAGMSPKDRERLHERSVGEALDYGDKRTVKRKKAEGE